MPVETLSPETHQDTIASQLATEQAVLSEAFPAVVEMDQEGFERVRFQISDGVTMVFRGREELPQLEANQDDTTVRKVLSIDERPLHTSGDEFGTWLSETTDEKPLEDPFERASETGANVEFIASETPMGIVDAALELEKLGIGDRAVRERLEGIRKKIEDRVLDEEVLGVYDMIYISGAVETSSGKPAAGYDSVRAGRVSPDGPMLVALALTGDEHAAKIMELKRQVVDLMDNTHVVVNGHQAEIAQREKPLKQPGEQLTREELDTLKEAHFVGVHTTETVPMVLDEKTGLRLLRPTAEYGVGDKGRYARGTIHWSLNHAVKSHLEGNFRGRPVTVVAPMEKLAELNGSPAVLYGVDTYFNSDPANGIIVPAEATLIQTHDESGPFVQVSGNVVRIRNQDITKEDLASFVDYMGPKLKPVNYESVYDGASYVAAALAHTDEMGLIRTYGSRFEERVAESIADWPQAAESYKPHIALYEVIKNHTIDLAREHDFTPAIKAAIEGLLKGEIDVAQYPDIAPLLTESIRLLLVNTAIRAHGGRVVQSDGMSAYVEDSDFQAQEKHVAETIGLRTGLHQYQPENYVEDSISHAISDATHYVEVPEDIRQKDPSVGSAAAAEFDWEKFDSFDIWGALFAAPWQSRRLAVDMGVLTFSKAAPPKPRKVMLG